MLDHIFDEILMLYPHQKLPYIIIYKERLFYELYRDILHFTGVQVLRITELVMPDYKVFQEMKQLRVLELVETHFASDEGCGCLKGLQQLACWLD